MISSVLRLLVILAVLAFPAMASQKAGPLAVDVPQASSFVLMDVSSESCVLPSSSCALCLTCLMVLPGIGGVIEMAHRFERYAPSTEALVDLLSTPEPIPP